MAFTIFCLWTMVGLFIFDKTLDQAPCESHLKLKWLLFALACGPLAWIFAMLIFFVEAYEWLEELWDDNDVSGNFKKLADKLNK